MSLEGVATRDDILTKEQLKTVLQHLSIHGRALALFLLSSGIRIGEACKLRMSDIDLDADPPWVNIRSEYTMSEAGGRVIWFSEEARNEIREWHKARHFKKKPGTSELYDKELVFNFRQRAFSKAWIRALRSADGERDPPVLARRDNSTKKRFHVYHTHTLRKFFRTNMGLAGVPDVIVHGWMGHKEYLEHVYDRWGKKRLAEIYKKHMDAVTVYDVVRGIRVDGALIDEIAEKIDAFAGLSEEEIEALSLEEKWTIIKVKVAKIKISPS